MPRLVTGPVDSQWTVVALCAEWCGTCRDYFTAFTQRAERHGAQRHLWIDIEDDSDWLGDLDIETLPSLLVLRDARPMFFGPVLPQIEVLERTLRALTERGPEANPVAAEDRAMVDRIVEDLVRERHIHSRQARAE